MNLDVKNLKEIKDIMEFAKWIREKPVEWKQFKTDVKFLFEEMGKCLDDLS
ncbi:MAG: hypothetical protein IIA87_03415 [Nanoarchaeota archaeon]|nr:hypothetical protein [Nanoarchaeota archaeon]